MPNPNEVMDVEKLREEFNERLCDYVADQYEAESHWALTLAQDSFYDWIVNTFVAQQNAALLRDLLTHKGEAAIVIGHDGKEEVQRSGLIVIPASIVEAKLKEMEEQHEQ